jgi:lipid-binding SYLF domain-containing protein
MKLHYLFMPLLWLCLALPAQAASSQEIDAKVTEAMQRFYQHSSAGRELAGRAAGVLMFPEVYKAGVGIGGEYGEGALLVSGATVDYYSTAAASIGFQLGAQIKSQVILFMTQDALNRFRQSEGWEAGVDGSVAIADIGAGGTIDSNTLQSPIIGFIFSNKGLMYNLTLEGSKFTRMNK